MKLPTLALSGDLEAALRSGHPWVYRNHLPRHTLRTGAWVRVQAGKAEAYGLYDDDGAVALRLFGHSGQGAPNDLNIRELVSRRVAEALALRESVSSSDTDSYRLLYGEGDFLPGVTVDRYGRYAALRTYAESVKTLVPEVVRALGHLKLRGVVTKDVVMKDSGSLEALYGELPPPELTVKENGLKLLANLYSGQKTGLFLDHRDNRRTLEHLSAGKRVLNLFSYTGAFSLYAARGGASHVTSVDIAPAATEDAKRNFALNGFDPDAHSFVSADVFTLLADLAAKGERYDVVVLDPPSLAKNKSSRHAALRAYGKLNAQAFRCVTPGGLLATASCTSQVSPEAFRDVLRDAAATAGVRAQVIHEAGHAPDHPVPISFPEGRYLKFVVARVL